MTVTEDRVAGTAQAVQTDANGTTWTVNVSINSANTEAVIQASSSSGDTFQNTVPVDESMIPAYATPAGYARASLAKRHVKSRTPDQQSAVARGVAMVAMGVLVIAGAPLAAAAIGIATGVAMVIDATTRKH